MAGSARRRSILVAVAASVLLHTGTLGLVRLDLEVEVLPLRPRAALTTVYRPSAVDGHGLDVVLPSDVRRRRRVTIERRRRVHRPGPARPDAPPGFLLGDDWLPPLGEGFVRPPEPAVTPPAPPARSPLLAALSRSTMTGVRPVPTGTGEFRLYFLAAGETAAEVMAEQAPPLVLVACDPARPAGPDGLDWRPPGDETLFRRPTDIRAWRDECGADTVLLGRRGGRVVAVWLAPEVRAGWEARHPAALALFDNLAAHPALSAALASTPAAPHTGSGRAPDDASGQEQQR